MKKNLYTLFAGAIISTVGFSQGSIPNGNFENWTNVTCDAPQNYPFNTNNEAYFKCNASCNVVKSSNAFHGNFALQMTTVAGNGDTAIGAIVNTDPNGNFPWPGGIPYNQRPTGITGHYKCSIASPDTGRILVLLKKGGVQVAAYVYSLYGTHNSYTTFTFSIDTSKFSSVDTVALAFTSSDFANKGVARAGSTVTLDSVSFTGVSSQPALMNGDFENWMQQTITVPNNWMEDGKGQGVMQTTDKVAGNYAVELTTYQGDNNGNPVARGGGIENGNCNGQPSCVLMGGYPFSNSVDTLCFWYKYVPVNNDSAFVQLNLRNNSQNNWYGKTLGASPNYQYMEMPFFAGFTPDTAIIQLSSSLWKDTLLSFIGSDLKVDEMHFKSQPLTTSIPTFHIDNNISIYPNPSSGEFNIASTLFNVDNVEVYNAVGEKIISKNINSKSGTLNLRDEGIYFVKINSNGKIVTKKIIVNK